MRTFHIETQSVWYDEAVSISTAYSNDPGILILEEHNHPPFYHLLLHFWILIVGQSIFTARLLSALLGVAAILLIYKLASRLFDRKVGFLSALIMTFSPFMIYFSQEARMFNLFIVLVLGSFYMFILILKDNKRSNWIGYFIFTLLLVYTFYLSVLVLSVQVIFLICRWKKYKNQLFRLIICQAFIVLLFAPWLIYFLKTAGGADRSYSENYIFRIPYIFITFMLGYSGLILNYYEKLHIAQTISKNIFLIGITVVTTAPLALWGIKKVWQKKDSAVLLLLFLGLPILILSALFPIVPLVSERYLSFLAPPFYIILSVGLISLSSKYIRFAALAAIGGLFVFSLYQYYFNPSFGKEEWKNVAEYIQQHSEAGDIVVFHKDYVVKPFAFYSQNKLPWYGIPERAVAGLNADSLEVRKLWLENRICHFDEPKFYALKPDILPDAATGRENAALLEWIGDNKRVWLILAKNYDTKFFYQDLFTKMFDLVDERTFPKMNGIELFLFKVKNRKHSQGYISTSPLQSGNFRSPPLKACLCVARRQGDLGGCKPFSLSRDRLRKKRRGDLQEDSL